MKEQESIFEKFRKEFSEIDMTDLEYSPYDLSTEDVPEDFQCYKESKNVSKAQKLIILDGNNYMFEVLRGESDLDSIFYIGLVTKDGEEIGTSASVEIFEKDDDYDSTACGVYNSSGIKGLGTNLRNIVNKTGREALDTAFNAGQIPQNVWDNIFVSFFEKRGYLKDDATGKWKKIYIPEK